MFLAQPRPLTLISRASVAFAAFSSFAHGRLGFVNATRNLLVANYNNRFVDMNLSSHLGIWADGDSRKVNIPDWVVCRFQSCGCRIVHILVQT